MELVKQTVEKICSFYVSDWHLVTMLLPYINKEINEKANIITILEKDIDKNVETLINKLNLKNREKILNLNWKKTNGIKYSEVKKNINKEILEDKLNIIFINGKKSYMDIVNKNIDKLLSENSKKYKEINIKIINCFEVGDFNMNILDILSEHSKILNTSGEKAINEVFDGYEEKANNM
jgi:hypothetical protein